MVAVARRPERVEATGPWQQAPCGMLWRRIDLSSPWLAAGTGLLAPDERERAGRFRFARDQNRFVAGRAALRLSLAEMSSVAPERLRFCYGEYGKPILRDEAGLRFNLSHSGDIGLIAIGRADLVGDIGIDVEQLQTVDDWRMLAEANFSAQECRLLEAVADDERARAFLSCWTRKEACVKALGTGLALPTSGFTVDFRGDRFNVSIAWGGAVHEIRGCAIEIGEACVAALAWCRSTRPEHVSSPTGSPINPASEEFPSFHTKHGLQQYSGFCIDLKI